MLLKAFFVQLHLAKTERSNKKVKKEKCWFNFLNTFFQLCPSGVKIGNVLLNSHSSIDDFMCNVRLIYSKRATFDKTQVGTILSSTSVEFFNEMHGVYSSKLSATVHKKDVRVDDLNKLNPQSETLCLRDMICDSDVRKIHLDFSHKLRTYALIKNTSFKHKDMESYLKYIDNRKKYSLLARLRMGVLPLRIETGRYEIVNNTKGIDVKYRLCRCCNMNKVEDEIHFLIECPFYGTLRNLLLNTCEAHLKKLVIKEELDATVLYTKIMKSDNREVIVALSAFVWRAYCKRYKYLQSTLTQSLE